LGVTLVNGILLLVKKRKNAASPRFFRPNFSNIVLSPEITMISVRLPDGSAREFDGPVTVAQVASSIATSLGKAALAGKVDGKVVDTSYLIDKNVDLSIVTDKDAEGLEVIRHSTAHLLAYAVKELFPDAQVTIGPVIENGFYYDFSYKRPFTPEDLVAIEKKMAELAKKDEPVTRKCCRATRPWRTSSRSASLQGRDHRLDPADQEVSLYAKAISPTCAAARTCRPPAS
jgi:threonyl-tRNA synthetase